jgi:hypothetical protein
MRPRINPALAEEWSVLITLSTQCPYAHPTYIRQWWRDRSAAQVNRLPTLIRDTNRDTDHQIPSISARCNCPAKAMAGFEPVWLGAGKQQPAALYLQRLWRVQHMTNHDKRCRLGEP